MPPRKHAFDEVGDELTSWIDETADHLVEGFYDGDRAPFAANLNQRQLTAYYATHLLNADGSRNEPAIQQFVQQRGEKAWADVQVALGRERRRDLDTTPPPPRQTEPPPAPEGY